MIKKLKKKLDKKDNSVDNMSMALVTDSFDVLYCMTLLPAIFEAVAVAG